jgi:hypothetical protein
MYFDVSSIGQSGHISKNELLKFCDNIYYLSRRLTYLLTSSMEQSPS